MIASEMSWVMNESYYSLVILFNVGFGELNSGGPCLLGWVDFEMDVGKGRRSHLNTFFLVKELAAGN